MFGIGFPELLVVFFAVLIFVNPKELPAVFRRLGRLVGQFRRWKRELMWTLNELEAESEPKDRGAAGAKIDKDGNIVPEINEIETSATESSGLNEGSVAPEPNTNDAQDKYRVS